MSGRESSDDTNKRNANGAGQHDITAALIGNVFGGGGIEIALWFMMISFFVMND